MDIREALEVASIEIKDGSNQDEINICCPFCIEEGELNVDERFRLGINVRTGAAHCFNCNKKGYGEWFLSELSRILETGTLELNESHRRSKKRKVMIELPEGYELLQHPHGHSDHWVNKAWRYIRKRGVTEKQIIEKKIGFTEIGLFHHRIIAPIYRHQKLLGFVGRDITDKMELKYLNSVGDKAVYNLPEKNHKSICLSEGFLDALAIERGSLKLGIDSGALLGHDLKDEQLELILKMNYKYILIWMDPDDAGIKGAIKISKKIPSDRVVKIVLPSDYENENSKDSDPGELEQNVIRHRLENAKRCTPELVEKLRAWQAFDE